MVNCVLHVVLVIVVIFLADTVCILNPDLNGICLHPTNFTDPDSGFPGDACENDYDCHFGPRRCINNICEGAAEGNCANSVDCTYGHYCANFYCLPLKQPVMLSYQL